MNGLGDSKRALAVADSANVVQLPECKMRNKAWILVYRGNKLLKLESVAVREALTRLSRLRELSHPILLFYRMHSWSFIINICRVRADGLQNKWFPGVHSAGVTGSPFFTYVVPIITHWELHFMSL